LSSTPRPTPAWRRVPNPEKTMDAALPGTPQFEPSGDFGVPALVLPASGARDGNVAIAAFLRENLA
jgi:hypothetical protein